MLFFTAAIDIFIPSITGFVRVISVQTAAVPIQPAPINRTLEAHTDCAKAAIVCPCSGGKILVRYGTSTPQDKSVPIKIDIPLAIPIRYPAPNKAMEKPIGSCVAAVRPRLIQ